MTLGQYCIIYPQYFTERECDAIQTAAETSSHDISNDNNLIAKESASMRFVNENPFVGRLLEYRSKNT